MLQVITELFPDYDRPVAFTFSRTGRVLLREGLMVPARLVRLGERRLLAMLRRRVPGVKAVTAERLVRTAGRPGSDAGSHGRGA